MGHAEGLENDAITNRRVASVETEGDPFAVEHLIVNPTVEKRLHFCVTGFAFEAGREDVVRFGLDGFRDCDRLRIFFVEVQRVINAEHQRPQYQEMQ